MGHLRVSLLFRPWFQSNRIILHQPELVWGGMVAKECSRLFELFLVKERPFCTLVDFCVRTHSPTGLCGAMILSYCYNWVNVLILHFGCFAVCGFRSADQQVQVKSAVTKLVQDKPKLDYRSQQSQLHTAPTRIPLAKEIASAWATN